VTKEDEAFRSMMSGSSVNLDEVLIEPLTPREVDILRLIAAGLSNREIGVQLFLSVGTVKWYNNQIFSKLDVPSRAAAIAKIHELQLFQQASTPTHNKSRVHLPSQPTAFIGRENELQEIASRILHPDCRLLTLTGSGGTGKTRLAVHAASQLQPHFRDGVFFTPLEPISSPDQVTAAIAQACNLHFYQGIDPQQQLFDFLHQKEVLLILDNFEHLLDAKSAVRSILEQTLHIRIILTTRVPLHLAEEWVFTILGMNYPEQNVVQDNEHFDAVRLFLACARRSGRPLSPEHDLPHIATICQFTRGIPLAIELAASWLRTLTCEEIAQELRADTDLLTTPLHDLPERHQSIRRVFQHSWKLLDEKDRKILRALSVFRGGFTSSALRAVTGASLTALAHLIDHSLVQVTGTGRYDLHPLISQYLQEQLLTSGELAFTSAAHAAYYAEFLQVRRPDLMGGRQLEALNEIQVEFENVSAAWMWLIDQQDYTNLEKAWEPLVLYSGVRGGRHLFNYLRTLPLKAENPHIVFAYLLCVLPDATEEDIQQALAIADLHQDVRAQAFALHEMGWFASLRHEYELSLTLYAESLNLFQRLGDAYKIARILDSIGFIYLVMGEKAKNNEVLQESLRISRSINDRLGIAGILHEMASTLFFDGEFAMAEPYLREALAINQEFGGGVQLLFCTQFSGHFPFLRGDFEAASQFYHDALLVAEDIGGIWLQAFALLLGFLANAEGDYLKADALFDASRTVAGFHPMMMMFVNWGQSITNCGLNRWQTTQEHLCASQKAAILMDSITFMLLCLSPSALILWNSGNRDLAVEMLALAFSHPKSQQGWFVKSPIGEHAIEHMKAAMGEPTFDQAWQQGAQRDLHETSAALQTLFDC
jgi:predicted ATPase/DNA-binding CsgD family transcriptional regulator